MRVLKFGGTSVANADSFLRVADILESYAKQEQVAIVLSAPAKITNHLVAMIQKNIRGYNALSNIIDSEQIFAELLQGLASVQPRFPLAYLAKRVEHEFRQIKYILRNIKILGQCSDSTNASLISRGEKLSIAIMAGLLESRGYQITIINPVKKLLAIGNYLESIVDVTESTRRIAACKIPTNHIILMAGFTAGNEKGELVVLGRNSSDYSAAVLAACLRADLCEIWTDVDGVYTCDPRRVPGARPLKLMSYQDAMDLSYYGAKVLHPRTILPIAQFQIPCFVKNITNPLAPGTLISMSHNRNSLPIKDISSLNKKILFNISNIKTKKIIKIEERIFSAMCRNDIAVLIAQSLSESNTSFFLSQNDWLHISQALEKELYSELQKKSLELLFVHK